MNRLLAKKGRKTAASPTTETPPTLDGSDAKRPQSSKGQDDGAKKRGWRRKKAEPEPEQPEVDILTALPDADSFRTSLIMTGLSSRFSMLRDPDDPLSLVGKANDDSVLTPKRRSRLVDFGHPGSSLYEIAEGPTTPGSDIRPPFAATQRSESYSVGDGFGTDDESLAGGNMMTRARPGEGNMLFGGRQKVYRIPVAGASSVNNLGAGEARGMKGRALYEDDVSMSSFQRLRAEEKARQQKEQLAQMDRDASMEEQRNGSVSSQYFRYDDRRNTTSSTNSGPSMISQTTQATSVSPSVPGSSPGLSSIGPSSGGKSRKLYEQALEHHLQEQQAAALSRLTSGKRDSSSSDSATPSRSQSAGNLRERFEREQSPVSPSLRAKKSSPPGPLKAAPTVLLSNDSMPASSRPMSPEESATDAEKALFRNLQPHERGLATATGRFNRPKQFSEEQFMQRQRSLAQQKQRPRKASAFSSQEVASPIVESIETSPEPGAAPSFNGRPRAGTNRTERSWSNASTNNEARLSTRPMIEEVPEVRDSPPEDETAIEASKETEETGTFLANDVDDESDYSTKAGRSRSSSVNDQTLPGETEESSLQSPSELEHPALRSFDMPILKGNTKAKRQAWSPDKLKKGLNITGDGELDYFTAKEPVEGETLSPQEPPAAGSDLKVLVREHLRQISNVSNSSSVYPSVRTQGADMDSFDTQVPSVYYPNNPFEGDLAPPMPDNAIETIAAEEAEGAQPEEEAEASSATPEIVADPDWRQQLNKHHSRGASTETAKERQAFNKKLLSARKTIEENMKVKNVAGPKPRSPLLPQGSWGMGESGRNPLNLLRNKTSREAMRSPRPDQRRPSASNGPSERVPSRHRSRDAHGQAIGRTLHSKLPRHSNESPMGSPIDEYGSFVRPSTEGAGGGTNSFSRTSPQDAFRGQPFRNRPGSELAHIPEKRQIGSRSRPSLDTKSLPRDSGSGRASTPASASAVDSRSTPILPVESVRSVPVSSQSTPALSQSSTPGLLKSNCATPGSMTTESSAGTQENTVVPSRSAGFFYPSATTPTETSSGLAVKKDASKGGPFRTRPKRTPTINKQDISEPTLLASTTAVHTVDLPEGASLQNGLRDDFDVVLMNRSNAEHDPSAPAPSPSISYSPTLQSQAAWKKGGFFRGFGKKDMVADDASFTSLGDEPEPRRFRIQRLENQEGRFGHRALRAGGPGESGQMSPTEAVPRGMI